MKALFQLAVCGALLAGGAMAQRGGGGGGHASMGGGGFSHGGGAVGGGGFSGGGYRGVAVGGAGYRGVAVGGAGYRGVAVGGVGYRGVAVGGVGYRGYYGGYGRYYGGYYGGYYPWYGYGYGYGLGYASAYYGYYGGYPYYSDPSYYSYPAYSTYPAYSAQPSVNVIYPPSQPSQTVYVDHASPVLRQYDQYGQPVGGGSSNYAAEAPSPNPGGSPIYLIATKDHNIQAAISYSVNGSVLEYVTLDHQQKRVQLDQVDRDLSQRINRERRVTFQLPGQQ